MPKPDGKQLADGSVPASKLATAYETTLFLVGGSRALTGTMDAGSQRIANLAAPTGANDAARLQDIQSIAWKQAVKAASTANLTLSAPQTVDGVALIAGDRVLVRNQTLPAENGIYVVAAGAWSRAADADSTAELRGAVVNVEQGTVSADIRFALTTDNVTPGTTAQVWANIGGASAPAYATTANKQMVCAVAATDGALATAVTLAAKPAGGANIDIDVNGILVSLGDGTKLGCECYISGDSGVTARAISAVAAGDQFFWNAIIAGYPLAAADRMSARYAI